MQANNYSLCYSECGDITMNSDFMLDSERESISQIYNLGKPDMKNWKKMNENRISGGIKVSSVIGCEQTAKKKLKLSVQKGSAKRKTRDELTE